MRPLFLAAALVSTFTTTSGFLGPQTIVPRQESSDHFWSKKFLTFQGRGVLYSSKKEDDDGTFRLPSRSRRTQNKDVVIVGAGLAGLSTALYLSQIDPNRHITIIDKQEHVVESKKKTTIASFAAAGMLAPQSERLPKGSLLDLCLASRKMYPDFCDLVETMARESGEEGAKYLFQKGKDEETNLDPWSVGYIASGFLAPAFAGDSVATWAPPDDGGSATWLDEIQVRELEPNLHPDVVGGWWFPEDASVDARRLTCSLYAACIAAGVEFKCGKGYEVSSLDVSNGKCHGLWIQNGKYYATKSVLVANGAWMRNLLPVPIEPHKGQSLSLQMPRNRPPILRRVLFAQDSYIVPKADGKIVIGATVEAGSFDGAVTPAGLLHILTHALQLVPGLQDLPLVETWAGLRPTTPDKGPILGKSPWDNLFLAGGYWRNGVLLAPKTAQLLACLMSDEELSDADQKLLKAFSWDRFTQKGGGAMLAANARYAASMHPIHSRTSGVGVAAAVGTELGSYSTAKAAKEERQKERQSLWETDSDDAFERAAALGRRDAASYTMGDEDSNPKSSKTSKVASESPVFFPEGDNTFAHDPVDETSSSSDLKSVYEKIKENKEKQDLSLSSKEDADDRPDPGFRIYYEDPDTKEKIEVPPYTSPGDFQKSIRKGGSSKQESATKQPPKATASESKLSSTSESTYNEQTYDGYQAILEATGGKSREDQLEAMRQARIRNRQGQDAIDESLIGAAKTELSEPLEDPKTEASSTDKGSGSDISSAYQKIKANKDKQKMSLPTGNVKDDRQDPGFRIYHVTDSGEKIEVPPYTSPGEFFESLQKTNGQEDQKPKKEVKKAEVANGAPHQEEEAAVPEMVINGTAGKESEYNEKTYDGYQEILAANSRLTREEELQAMREARKRNRMGQAGVDESKLD